jgi:hypothetical protein
MLFILMYDDMADSYLMYGITTGAFVIFIGILFGVRTRRMNQTIKRAREDKQKS